MKECRRLEDEKTKQVKAKMSNIKSTYIAVFVMLFIFALSGCSCDSEHPGAFPETAEAIVSSS